MAKRKTTSKAFLQAQPRSFRERRVDTRSRVQRFLIVCEGAETEKNYFESFRVPSDVRDIMVHGIGRNALSLVQETQKIRSELESDEREMFDQIWCVFDRDSFPAQQFNEAIQLADQKGFQVAYSNEAFEIWYLLHFDYHQAALSRKQYKGKLTEKLGFAYRKNDPAIYSLLQSRQGIAIRNADKLLRHHERLNGNCNPERDNPVTTVHRLVQELKRFSPDSRAGSS